MRRLGMLLALAGAGMVAVSAAVIGAWGFVLAAIVGGLGVWMFGQCRHPGPLGLLPPTTDHDGTQISARWYCDSCGKAWPAVFEHGHPPVRKFEGFDPSKAVNAAKRADDLARRQRVLAMRRAGIETPRPPRLRPDAAEVVAIRRFAK